MTMLKIMLGTNFDKELPRKLNYLNHKYERNNVRVTEVYGSIQDFRIFGSARPKFRVSDISISEFERQVAEYREYGINVNYTENTPIIKKSEIDKAEIKRKLEYLQSIGVSRITLAHPLAIELVTELSDMKIEISTIYKCNTEYQLIELNRRSANINKVCLDVSDNRNFDLIAKLNSTSLKLGIDIELLANEFCITNCADRVQCYNEHAQNENDSDAAKFKRYPMGICTNIRTMNPIEWTRARFILPQSLNFYSKHLGITHFKVTGRTHPTHYILEMAEAYLSEHYSGNLLQLWADVKNIPRVAKGKTEFLAPKYQINAETYDDTFLMKYFDSKIQNSLEAEYEMLEETLKTSLNV